MSISLMNDSGYTDGFINELVQMGEVLFFTRESSLREAKRSTPTRKSKHLKHVIKKLTSCEKALNENIQKRSIKLIA